MAVPNQVEEHKAMAKKLTLMAMGDIFIGSPDDYPRVHNPVFRIVPMTRERPDLFSWLEDVAPILQHGDFIMGNLKGYVDPERKQISRFTFIPIVLPDETMQPRGVPIGVAGNYVTLLAQLSRKYGTKFEIDGDEIAIHGS